MDDASAESVPVLSVAVSCRAENIAPRERRACQHEQDVAAKKVAVKEVVEIDVDVSPPLRPAALRPSTLLLTRKPPSASPATDNVPMSEWGVIPDG